MTSTLLSTYKFPFGFRPHSSHSCPSGLCSHSPWHSRSLISFLDRYWHTQRKLEDGGLDINFRFPVISLFFHGMGWLVPCPTPNLEEQGFSVGVSFPQPQCKWSYQIFKGAGSSPFAIVIWVTDRACLRRVSVKCGPDGGGWRMADRKMWMINSGW